MVVCQKPRKIEKLSGLIVGHQSAVGNKARNKIFVDLLKIRTFAI